MKRKTKVFQTSEFHKCNSDSAQEPDKVEQVVLDILYKERVKTKGFWNPIRKRPKAYIAGPLCTKPERQFLEKIDKICKKYKIKTFLPHRDCGLWKSMKDVKRIAKGDLDGFNGCNLLIANLNGFNIGAGTAWEMGYAHAKGIPVIAIKTDRKLKESIEEISAIVMGTTNIVTSLKALEKEIKKFLLLPHTKVCGLLEF